MSHTWSQFRYRVQANTRVTPVICELALAPVAEPLVFQAGQYVLLGDTDWRVPQRSYSVASAPRVDGSMSLLVTRVEGGPTSTWAHGLRAGDEVLLEGAFGTFVTAPERTGPILLLGAGSGLAPVRALAEDLRAHGSRRETVLFFSCRTRTDCMDAGRFTAWQAEGGAFRYACTLTREPDAPLHHHAQELLAQVVAPDLTGWEVFASGPSGFVVGCSEAAQALGADLADVHTEEFFTDPQPWLGAMPPKPAQPAEN